jgi:tRNA threonylcarbamoyl adenosine modification protein (Sua5/YciO/YrdC/YwlC family)
MWSPLRTPRAPTPAASPTRRAAAPTSAPPRVVRVAPDASDAWRLDPVVAALNAGALAVIPTDSFPALAVLASARDGAALLYDARRTPKAERRPLSLLCRGFADVDAYTLGWPAPREGGEDLFRVAKRVLPGPYTLILPAAGALKHVVDASTSKKKARRSVGVRLPAHPVARAVLAGVSGPLLVASAAAPGGACDAVEIADALAHAGSVAFVVDTGEAWPAEGSTVIDLAAAGGPKVVRRGLGDPSPWVDE